jgi:hypothetical protein
MGQNKVSLEVVKTWFHTTPVAAPRNVPPYFYQYVHSLGLIDSDLDPDDLREAAISECFVLFEFALSQVEPRFKQLLRKKRLSKTEEMEYDKLLLKVEAIKMHRNYLAQFKMSGVLHEDIKLLFQDMHKRTVVFYSKPLATISDLGELGGVTGAPTE